MSTAGGRFNQHTFQRGMFRSESYSMSTYKKRVKRNIVRNQLLDRELDYLPSGIDRDEVREIARMYGPRPRRTAPVRLVLGAFDFAARYSAPFLGMIVGAEYQAAKALYPLIGEEQSYGESLRLFLGEDLSRRIEDTSKAFKVTGALVAATPDIVFSALYGAIAGIVVYCALKWGLAAALSVRRRLKLRRKIAEMLG